jgi:hypothetical protein
MADFSDAKVAFDALKLGLGLFRDAIGLARDVQSSLPEGEKKKAITESLARADVSSRTAEAQIAQSFGYNLCKCTFPPQIMLSVGIRFEKSSGMDLEHFQCASCKKEST